MHQTLTRPACSSAQEILDFLTVRQHVRPHKPLSAVMTDLQSTLGACPAAVDRAVTWLNLATNISVGRLRRTELTQLARSVHRFWRATLNHSLEV